MLIKIKAHFLNFSLQRKEMSEVQKEAIFVLTLVVSTIKFLKINRNLEPNPRIT
jgi:hypothetical protein